MLQVMKDIKVERKASKYGVKIQDSPKWYVHSQAGVNQAFKVSYELPYSHLGNVFNLFDY